MPPIFQIMDQRVKRLAFDVRVARKIVPARKIVRVTIKHPQSNGQGMKIIRVRWRKIGLRDQPLLDGKLVQFFRDQVGGKAAGSPLPFPVFNIMKGRIFHTTQIRVDP
ncbi:hypothetical protein CJD35_22120 (plasmid) [Sphingobium xenophagum]|uniref:Uncharacterized protein n=1 Tax=Sphingobium xenophagum TaxID=121428 RepID=A0A249N0W9_SPHXE|nr:hypothetical protein CJD35_22120 [Sphingobium xenophagum]